MPACMSLRPRDGMLQQSLTRCCSWLITCQVEHHSGPALRPTSHHACDNSGEAETWLASERFPVESTDDMGRGEGRVQIGCWTYSLDVARTALHAGFAITCCKVGACARRACHFHLPHVLRAALCVDMYHPPVSLCCNRFLQHLKHPLRRGSVRGCGRCGSVLLRGDDAAIMHAVLHCCYMNVIALLVMNGCRMPKSFVGNLCTKIAIDSLDSFDSVAVVTVAVASTIGKAIAIATVR
jgi:hypothetical protein